MRRPGSATSNASYKLMGPINPLALEEFTAPAGTPPVPGGAARGRQDDAARATRVIKAVDTEIQTVFAQAFTDVSANFSELFGLLFPGGVGSLVLTNPDDLLEHGYRGRGQAERQEREEAVALVGR